MTKTNNILLTLTLALLGVFVALVATATPVTVNAADNKADSSKQEAKKPEDKGFKYVAQPGDSFSLFARKAIQTYGINNKVKLNPAQIIFAETTLTQAAGSPVLSLGETRTISENSVKEVVEKAGKLTKEQQAAWAVYAVNADFNTDKVGEVRK